MKYNLPLILSSILAIYSIYLCNVLPPQLEMLFIMNYNLS
jgi:hypothetical protein